MNRSIAFLCVLILLGGCDLSNSPPPRVKAEVYISDPNSVGFDITPASGNGSWAWIGTYSSGGTTARFRYEFGLAKTIDKPVNDVVVTSGKGRFIAMEGSDASVLLNDLMKALEAKKLPVKVRRVKELPFTFISFGDHESQAFEGGGFSPEPPGNWTANKIFIGEGKNEVEFFLNFNPVIKKGQFSIKDEEYGD